MIPAYNEERIIINTLSQLNIFLSIFADEFEIIVIDDGSTDNTFNKAIGFTKHLKNYKIRQNSTNKGKGYSIRHGVSCAKYKTIVVLDADLSVDISELENIGWDFIEYYNLIKGKRVQVKKQSLFRRMLGNVWRMLVWLKLGVYVDSQCPFLVINGERMRERFLTMEIDGFAYDIELIKKFKDEIKWVYVEYNNNKDSSVTIKKVIRMFYDLLRL